MALTPEQRRIIAEIDNHAVHLELLRDRADSANNARMQKVKLFHILIEAGSDKETVEKARLDAVSSYEAWLDSLSVFYAAKREALAKLDKHVFDELDRANKESKK